MSFLFKSAFLKIQLKLEVEKSAIFTYGGP